MFLFILPNKKSTHTASLPRSQLCPLVSKPALLRGTQLVSTCVLLRKRAKTAACSITRAASEGLRVGIAHKSEALEKLREEIGD